MRHLQTVLLIFAEKLCRNICSFIIWPKWYEKIEFSLNSIIQHSGVSACLVLNVSVCICTAERGIAKAPLNSVLMKQTYPWVWGGGGYLLYMNRFLNGISLSILFNSLPVRRGRCTLPGVSAATSLQSPHGYQTVKSWNIEPYGPEISNLTVLKYQTWWS